MNLGCKESIRVFDKAWDSIDNGNFHHKNISLEVIVPELPDNYREVFQNCIKTTAEPDVRNLLVSILIELQIHQDRMKGLVTERYKKHEILKSYFSGIAKIRALINRHYEYARGSEDFDNSPLVLDDYKSALRVSGNLKIRIEKYNDLQGFIERAIDRSRKKGEK